MRLRLLGGVELSVDGVRVQLRGPTQRAALVLLWLRRGQTVPTDVLIDELWAGEPPAQARNSLQSHLSNLRRALPAPVAEHLLPRQPSGYLLVDDLADSDLVDFERATVAGASALRSGRSEEAVALLEAALASWTGDPFHGVRDTLAIEAERSRLEAERFEVEVDLLDARSMGGDTAAVLARLEALTADHRWHERLWRIRIRALYRTGRHADAVTVATAARRHLADEKGLVPSPDFEALEQQVLSHDDRLRPGAPPEDAPVRVEIPDPPARLVGRSAELERLDEALARASVDGPRVVVVEGGRGVGKTALLSSFVRSLDRRGDAVGHYGHCRRPSQQVAVEAMFGSVTEPSNGRPVVLAIDDLHDASDSLVDRLCGLVDDGGDRLPLLAVVASRRAGQLSGTHRLTRIAVDDLTEADLAVLADDVGAGRRLHRWSGGNAFFATELLGTALPSFCHRWGRVGLDGPGEPDRPDWPDWSDWHGGPRIPERVGDTVVDRVGRLSEPARILVTELAVAAETTEACELDALLTASAVPSADLVTAIDELLAADLAWEPPTTAATLALKQPIVGHVVSQRLSRARRIAIRRAFGVHTDPTRERHADHIEPARATSLSVVNGPTTGRDQGDGPMRRTKQLVVDVDHPLAMTEERSR